MVLKKIWMLIAVALMLLALPLGAEARRPEGVGRPTVTVVPPVPVLPSLPTPGVTPTPRSPVAAQRLAPQEDPSAPWLGSITVLTNRAGFHLWFTPRESREGYLAGRLYHAVFRLRSRCGPGWTSVTVPDRAPYAGTGFVGQQMCYRVSGPDGEPERVAMAD